MTNTTMEKQIQELIDEHEAFKLKWMELTTADMFRRIELKEKMKVQVIELKSQIMETKAWLEKDKAIRTLELKATTDCRGKTPTEKMIDSKLKLEFEKRDNEVNALIKYRDLLSEYADNVLEYVNVVKLNMRNDLPF